MQPPPSTATLRARRAATHAPSAPRPSLSHISFERGPPKRAPMPPPFYDPSCKAPTPSKHPPNAPQGRIYPAQPPWHPNSPQPLSFERPNRRTIPANPHHLHTIQSLHTTQNDIYLPNSTTSATDTNMVRRHRLQSAATMLRARATDARLLEPASHPLPTREELAMRPRIRARLLPTTCYLLPATCYPTPSTTPRTRNACLAAALATGALAACMLLLPPPCDPYASGDGLRGPVKNAMGPSPFYRNYALGQSHRKPRCTTARDDPATHGIAASLLSIARPDPSREYPHERPRTTPHPAPSPRSPRAVKREWAQPFNQSKSSLRANSSRVTLRCSARRPCNPRNCCVASLDSPP